jgi:hypothetical protein
MANRKAAKAAKVAKSKPRVQGSEAGRAKYPRHSLTRALRIPRAILDQNAGKACTPSQAASFVGLGTAAGPFGVEVSSASKYGLLERPEPGKIQPSALAKKILRPQSDHDELDGYREAILKAPDISEVYKHYRGENLPDDRFLQNTVRRHIAYHRRILRSSSRCSLSHWRLLTSSRNMVTRFV